MDYKQRYCEAHFNWSKERYPNLHKDGLYTKPLMPVVSKANGLTKFIENFINWSGYRATRINNIARLPDKVIKTASGQMFNEKRFSRSTRKGQADISSTIKGRSVMWEIKVGNDRPSEHQLKEQQKEINAGGHYFFIKDPVTFFQIYDALLIKFT